MSLWGKLRRLLLPSTPTPTDEQLEELQRLLGYQFRDQELLRLSLSHRSATRVNGCAAGESNERLEFLGDSVLGLVIADQLYRDNPDMPEGDLTKQKAMLVNEATLAHVAVEVGLNRFVLMSPEEDRSGGRTRPSIISDAFEAVIGALFVDGGLRVARPVVLNWIYSRRESIISDGAQQNYKGNLLELMQGLGRGMPQYDIVSESGPDHDKTFKVRVMIEGTCIGDGVGSSKKEAEQRAACKALEFLAQNQALLNRE